MGWETVLWGVCVWGGVGWTGGHHAPTSRSKKSVNPKVPTFVKLGKPRRTGRGGARGTGAVLPTAGKLPYYD